MLTIKVLGSGCANCKATTKLVTEVAEEMKTPVNVEKVEDIADIMGYGVMSTPGVVIDEKVVHAGGIPDRNSIKAWLSGENSSGGCCGGDTSNSSGGCCG
ncbi:MAG: thioredoxin family protein [bacterium]